MTYISARRRAEVMTVVMVFRGIITQCIAQGDPIHHDPLCEVMFRYDLALAEAMDGLDKMQADLFIAPPVAQKPIQGELL